MAHLLVTLHSIRLQSLGDSLSGYILLALDLGWVAHFLVRLQSLRPQSWHQIWDG